MKTFCILTCAAAALILSVPSAFAGMGGGGGGNTTRPSYDNPRDYDRDAYGNETYYPRNTWFGPRYYYDEDRPVRKSKKKVVKKKHYDD